MKDISEALISQRIKEAGSGDAEAQYNYQAEKTQHVPLY
jgi:hypothetical protein